ncbi:MAG: 7-carboxy-7-deazaguanine synthase QueE [Capsulimonadaceae bacterium]|nr:7-carboxy-7-deazaguanine synthase QueE [Capsulimonadaceae bacterium]
MEARIYRGETPDPAQATRDAMAMVKAGRIPIVELFYSLQGEGLRSGQATVFVRSAGCNCDCWFCDTDFRVQRGCDPDELAEEVETIGRGCRWACLTGGEPTIHDFAPLCDILKGRGWQLQIETNGTRARPDWGLDHITVSPKERQGARLDRWYYENAAEFKYVIDDPDDLAYALESRRRHDKAALLQPNALNPAAVALCTEAILAHPQEFRLSLQTHKFIGVR